MENTCAISRPLSVATLDIQMTFEGLISVGSISTSDRAKFATNAWMEKDLYMRSQAEKLLGILEQYECQNVGDAAKPDPVYLVDFDGFYKPHSAEPIRREREVSRAWVSFASGKVDAALISYCQYRNRLVGHCSPRASRVASHAQGMLSGCAGCS